MTLFFVVVCFSSVENRAQGIKDEAFKWRVDGIILMWAERRAHFESIQEIMQVKIDY